MSQLINSDCFNGLTLSVVGIGGGGAGVSQITSADGSITLNPTGGTGDVDLSVNFPEPSGVQSITSSDNSITITKTEDGADDLSVNFPLIPAGVSSLNSLTSNINIVDGTNTTVNVNSEANTISINVPPFPTTDRTSTVLVAGGVITAITSGTAQTVATLTLTTSYVSNIDVSLSFTIQSNSNQKEDINYTISIGGIASSTFRNTINGVGHYGSCSSGASRENVPAGDTVIIVKMYASSASVFTVAPLQMRAIGNLSQG